MPTQFRGLALSAAAALFAAALLAGCGGGASPGGTGAAGISASASLSGNTVSVSARTDSTDIASVWAVITGVNDLLTLNGSGHDWSGSTQVIAQAGSTITIQVFARDSLGNQIGPAVAQVQLGQFGSQPTVTGTVVSNGQPVVGAQVSLGDQATGTDSAGRFVFASGLLAGTTLEGVITKSGFAEARFTVTVSEGTVDVGRIGLTGTQDLPPPVPAFP